MTDILNGFSELYQKDPTRALFILSVFGAFLAIIITLILSVPVRHVKKLLVNMRLQKEFSQKREEYWRKMDDLPKLRTEFLIKVPGEIYPELKRTFGSRYDRYVVYDEEGQQWLGLHTVDLINDLVAAKFTPSNYWVKFGGPGEMYSVPVVEIDGIKIGIYPLFLTNFKTNSPEWRQWLKIEKNDIERCKQKIVIPSYYNLVKDEYLLWEKNMKEFTPDSLTI